MDVDMDDMSNARARKIFIHCFGFCIFSLQKKDFLIRINIENFDAKT